MQTWGVHPTTPDNQRHAERQPNPLLVKSGVRRATSGTSIGDLRSMPREPLGYKVAVAEEILPGVRSQYEVRHQPDSATGVA